MTSLVCHWRNKMFILVIEANANPCGIVRRVDKRQEIRISLICRPAEAHRNAADGAAAVLQINGERLPRNHRQPGKTDGSIRCPSPR